MSGPFWLWQLATWGLLLAGLVGAVAPLPWLPGLPLIFTGIWLHGWATDFVRIDGGFLAVQAGLAGLGMALDYVASAWGARASGGSRAAGWGAFFGGLVGLFFLPLGLLVGPFVGALAAELLTGKDLSGALRSGWGALGGLCGGAVLKLLVALVMIGLFLARA